MANLKRFAELLGEELGNANRRPRRCGAAGWELLRELLNLAAASERSPSPTTTAADAAVEFLAALIDEGSVHGDTEEGEQARLRVSNARSALQRALRVERIWAAADSRSPDEVRKDLVEDLLRWGGDVGGYPLSPSVKEEVETILRRHYF